MNKNRFENIMDALEKETPEQRKKRSDMIRHVLNSKRIEPEKRLVAGRFGYAFHTYPIKGGISWAKMLAKNIEENNALMKKLARMGPKNGK